MLFFGSSCSINPKTSRTIWRLVFWIWEKTKSSEWREIGGNLFKNANGWVFYLTLGVKFRIACVLQLPVKEEFINNHNKCVKKFRFCIQNLLFVSQRTSKSLFEKMHGVTELPQFLNTVVFTKWHNTKFEGFKCKIFKIFCSIFPFLFKLRDSYQIKHNSNGTANLTHQFCQIHFRT